MATAAEFASYLGGIEDVASATVQLDLMIASATARIEQVLGYSFRARTFRLEIPKGNRCLAIWLPWGPASTVTVTVDGSDFTDFETERRYRHVDFIAVDTAEAYRIEWDVGAASGYPPEFTLEVYRVAAALWNMPGADGLPGAHAGRVRASLVLLRPSGLALMAGRTQLKVLTQVDRQGNEYTKRFVFGEIGTATRQLIDESGARLPIGGTDFIVNRGAVLLSEVVSVMGQNFKVVGIRPVPPWFRQGNELTTDIATSCSVRLGPPSRLIDDSGARLPIGGTDFLVDRGDVLLSEVVSLMGQNFMIKGAVRRGRP